LIDFDAPTLKLAMRNKNVMGWGLSSCLKYQLQNNRTQRYGLKPFSGSSDLIPPSL
jgi:hypothetical protein